MSSTRAVTDITVLLFKGHLTIEFEQRHPRGLNVLESDVSCFMIRKPVSKNRRSADLSGTCSPQQTDK